MSRLMILVIAAVAASPCWTTNGVAQETSRTEPAYGGYLFPSLNTEDYRWTLNHICVPTEIPVVHNAKNRDFVQAIVGFLRMRWELGTQAATKGDRKRADFFRGYIAHTIIDLYWPDRVHRDQDGGITSFRPCTDFGGGRGIISLEQNPPEDVRARMSQRSKGTEVLTAVMKLYVGGRPFDEAESTIRAGLLRLAPDQEGAPLVRP